jgi:hypothetical protein
MAIFFLAAAASAKAATYTWTSINSGNWRVPGNWSPNGVPGGGDSAAVTTTGNGII